MTSVIETRREITGACEKLPNLDPVGQSIEDHRAVLGRLLMDTGSDDATAALAALAALMPQRTALRSTSPAATAYASAL